MNTWYKFTHNCQRVNTKVWCFPVVLATKYYLAWLTWELGSQVSNCRKEVFYLFLISLELRCSKVSDFQLIVFTYFLAYVSAAMLWNWRIFRSIFCRNDVPAFDPSFAMSERRLLQTFQVFVTFLSFCNSSIDLAVSVSLQWNKLKQKKIKASLWLHSELFRGF